MSAYITRASIGRRKTYTLVVKTEVSVVGVDDAAWHATLELGVGDAFDEGDHGFTGLIHVVRFSTSMYSRLRLELRSPVGS
jgi:hypothetical protein